MSEQETIRRAREQFDEFIRRLPSSFGDSRKAAEKMAAQARVLSKLSSAKDRDALFWFAVSLLDHFIPGRLSPWPTGQAGRSENGG